MKKMLTLTGKIFLLLLSFGMIGMTVEAQDDDTGLMNTCAMSLPQLEGIVTMISGVTGDPMAESDLENSYGKYGLTVEDVFNQSSFMFSTGSSYSQPVTILVVDFYDDTIAENRVPGTDISHGDLVFNYIQQLVDIAKQQDPNLPINVRPVSADPIKSDDGSLQYLTTSILSERINNELEETSAVHYVINLSIALVPCTPEGQISDNLEDYILNINGPTATTPEEKEQAVERVLRQDLLGSTDPLVNEATQCATSNVREYVAGAGNAGYPFAFAPAAWPQMIAVGAYEMWGDGSGTFLPTPPPQLAPYSNFGPDYQTASGVPGVDVDVYEIGGWIQGMVSDTSGQNLAVQGTSLAAPLQSVRIAFALEAGVVIGHRCSLKAILDSYNQGSSATAMTIGDVLIIEDNDQPFHQDWIDQIQQDFPSATPSILAVDSTSGVVNPVEIENFIQSNPSLLLIVTTSLPAYDAACQTIVNFGLAGTGITVRTIDAQPSNSLC